MNDEQPFGYYLHRCLQNQQKNRLGIEVFDKTESQVFVVMTRLCHAIDCLTCHTNLRAMAVDHVAKTLLGLINWVI